MALFKERGEDRMAVSAVNTGAALPVNDRFGARLELLLEEAVQCGAPTEMTAWDWDDIEQKGLAILRSRKTS
jgi:hypothetical protein